MLFRALRASPAAYGGFALRQGVGGHGVGRSGCGYGFGAIVVHGHEAFRLAHMILREFVVAYDGSEPVSLDGLIGLHESGVDVAAEFARSHIPEKFLGEEARGGFLVVHRDVAAQFPQVLVEKVGCVGRDV